MKFIDEVTIDLSSGKGGAGCVSFRREALIPRGGPDGGDGGRGADVVFRVNPMRSSLIDLRFKRKYQAPDGEPGRALNMSGKNAEDLVVEVPPGTLIKNADGQLIVDLTEPQDFVFLKGGLGGKGNTFYKTSVNQAPGIAQKGMPGEAATVALELKLLADVGIIGLPNAGKSTLISRISAARPKVADYPFTTLVPNLGVVKCGDFRSFVVADIPGLIEGAHEGIGLGIQFLRHIERCRVFIHMVDVSEMSGKEPWAAFTEIQNELQFYDKSKVDEEEFSPLASREQMVVLNKVDTIDKARLDEIVNQFKANGIRTHIVSAVTGQNIKELVFEIGKKVFGEENKNEI